MFRRITNATTIIVVATRTMLRSVLLSLLRLRQFWNIGYTTSDKTKGPRLLVHRSPHLRRQVAEGGTLFLPKPTVSKGQWSPDSPQAPPCCRAHHQETPHAQTSNLTSRLILDGDISRGTCDRHIGETCGVLPDTSYVYAYQEPKGSCRRKITM